MPALVAFGRKWHIGSDDIVIPSFIDLIIRIFWLFAAVIFYSDEDFIPEKCPGEDFLKMYIYATFTLLHLTIFTDAALVQNSKAGNAMDVNSRKYVPICIYIRFLLQLIEITLGILGTYWKYNNYFNCENDDDISTSIHLIQKTIIGNWISITLAILVILITFDPNGNKFSNNNNLFIGHENQLPPETIYTKLWEFRCRCIGCACTHQPDENPFNEVGKILGTSLQGEDLVLSDITTGFAILCLRNTRKKFNKFQNNNKIIQEKFIQQCPIIIEPKIILPIDPLTNESWDSIRMINYYLKYSMAAYSWRFLPTQKNPLKKMWTNTFCCNCLPWRKFQTTAEIDNDNCCFCNTAAIKSVGQIDYDNIILASFKNDYYEQQYFIAVDHLTKSIIVSICGSVSYKDHIIDLTCWPVKPEIPGISENFKVHHGFFHSAKVLMKKLEDKKLLEDATIKYPGYNIILTGHSLGAATSTMLGLLLRPKYPNLKCYVYSPPGCCLSMEAADYCNDFVLSTTYGDDIATRLSLHSTEKIKKDIKWALQTCSTPKYRILMRTCCILNGGIFSSIDETYMNESKLEKYDQNLEKNSSLDNFTYGSFYSKETNNVKGEKFRCPRLYPPGRILHITENPNYCKEKKFDYEEQFERWQCRWANRIEFEDLIISTRMGLDHLPYRMSKSLKYLTLSNFIVNEFENKCLIS